MNIVENRTLGVWTGGTYNLWINFKESILRDNQSLSLQVGSSLYKGTGPLVLLNWNWEITFEYNSESYTRSGSGRGFLSSISMIIPDFSISITDTNRSEKQTIKITSFKSIFNSILYKDEYSETSLSLVLDGYPKSTIILEYYTTKHETKLIKEVSAIPTHPIQTKSSIEGYGYFCSVWNTKEDGTGTTYNANDQIYVDDTLQKLYATSYTPIKYNINLVNKYSASGNTEQALWKSGVDYDSLIDLPNGLDSISFTISNDKVFIGWTKTEDSKIAIYDDNSSVMNIGSKDNETVSIYTVVRDKNYKLNFNRNYNSLVNYSIPEKDVQFDSSLQSLLINPLRETSYKFNKWLSVEDSRFEISGDNSVIMRLNRRSYNLVLSSNLFKSLCALITYKSDDVNWQSPIVVSKYFPSVKYSYSDDPYSIIEYIGNIEYNDETWFYALGAAVQFDNNVVYASDSSKMHRINISEVLDKIYTSESSETIMKDIGAAATEDLLNLYHKGLEQKSTDKYLWYNNQALKAKWSIAENYFFKINDVWKPCLIYQKIDDRWVRMYPYRKDSTKWHDFGIRFVTRMYYNMLNTVSYKLISPSNRFFRRYSYQLEYDYVDTTMSDINGNQVSLSDDFCVNKDISIRFDLEERNITSEYNGTHLNIYNRNELINQCNINLSKQPTTNEVSDNVYLRLIDDSNNTIANATFNRYTNTLTNHINSDGEYYPIILQGSTIHSELGEFVIELDVHSSLVDLNLNTTFIEITVDSSTTYQYPLFIGLSYERNGTLEYLMSQELTLGTPTKLYDLFSVNKVVLGKSIKPYNINNIENGFLSFLLIRGDNFNPTQS